MLEGLPIGMAGPGDVDWRQLSMVVGSELLRYAADAAGKGACGDSDDPSTAPQHHPSPRGAGWTCQPCLCVQGAAAARAHYACTA